MIREPSAANAFNSCQVITGQHRKQVPLTSYFVLNSKNNADPDIWRFLACVEGI